MGLCVITRGDLQGFSPPRTRAVLQPLNRQSFRLVTADRRVLSSLRHSCAQMLTGPEMSILRYVYTKHFAVSIPRSPSQFPSLSPKMTECQHSPANSEILTHSVPVLKETLSVPSCVPNTEVGCAPVLLKSEKTACGLLYFPNQS